MLFKKFQYLSCLISFYRLLMWGSSTFFFLSENQILMLLILHFIFINFCSYFFMCELSLSLILYFRNSLSWIHHSFLTVLSFLTVSSFLFSLPKSYICICKYFYSCIPYILMAIFLSLNLKYIFIFIMTWAINYVNVYFIKM